MLDVSKNGKPLGTMEPTRRFYKAAQQATAIVALRSRLNEDLYINYAARNRSKATLQAYVFPLVDWIWIGAVSPDLRGRWSHSVPARWRVRIRALKSWALLRSRCRCPVEPRAN